MRGTGAIVGTKAPDFSLKNQFGERFQLSEHLQNGPTVLAFYPGDFTLVCTKQLCNYRDNWDTFKDLGIQIVGVSGNTEDDHGRFTKRYDFKFPLLSDPGKKVARLYGCTSVLMFGAVSRAVAIINRQGVLLYRYVEPTALTHQNAGELLKIIQDLRDNKLM